MRSKSISYFLFFKKNKKKNDSCDSVIISSNKNLSIQLSKGEDDEKNEINEEKSYIKNEDVYKKEKLKKKKENKENNKKKDKNEVVYDYHDISNDATSDYVNNYKVYEMNTCNIKKKRESFFKKINILQKYKNYKIRKAASTFHTIGHKTSFSGTDDEIENNQKKQKKYKIKISEWKDDKSHTFHKKNDILVFDKMDKNKKFKIDNNKNNQINIDNEERVNKNYPMATNVQNFNIKYTSIDVTNDEYIIDSNKPEGSIMSTDKKNNKLNYNNDTYDVDKSSDINKLGNIKKNKFDIITKTTHNINNNVNNIHNYMMYTNKENIKININHGNLNGREQNNYDEERKANVYEIFENAKKLEPNNININTEEHIHISEPSIPFDMKDHKNDINEKDIILKLMYNNNGIYFDDDDENHKNLLYKNKDTHVKHLNNKFNHNFIIYNDREEGVNQKHAQKKLKKKNTILNKNENEDINHNSFKRPLSNTNICYKDKDDKIKNGSNKYDILNNDYSNEHEKNKYNDHITKNKRNQSANEVKSNNNDNHNNKKNNNFNININDSYSTNINRNQNVMINDVNDVIKDPNMQENTQGDDEGGIINKYLINPIYNLFLRANEEIQNSNSTNNKLKMNNITKSYTNELQKTYKSMYDINDISNKRKINNKDIRGTNLYNTKLCNNKLYNSNPYNMIPYNINTYNNNNNNKETCTSINIKHSENKYPFNKSHVNSYMKNTNHLPHRNAITSNNRNNEEYEKEKEKDRNITNGNNNYLVEYNNSCIPPPLKKMIPIDGVRNKSINKLNNVTNTQRTSSVSYTNKNIDENSFDMPIINGIRESKYISNNNNINGNSIGFNSSKLDNYHHQSMNVNESYPLKNMMKNNYIEHNYDDKNNIFLVKNYEDTYSNIHNGIHENSMLKNYNLKKACTFHGYSRNHQKNMYTEENLNINQKKNYSHYHNNGTVLKPLVNTNNVAVNEFADINLSAQKRLHSLKSMGYEDKSMENYRNKIYNNINNNNNNNNNNNDNNIYNDNEYCQYNNSYCFDHSDLKNMFPLNHQNSKLLTHSNNKNSFFNGINVESKHHLANPEIKTFAHNSYPILNQGLINCNPLQCLGYDSNQRNKHNVVYIKKNEYLNKNIGSIINVLKREGLRKISTHNGKFESFSNMDNKNVYMEGLNIQDNVNNNNNKESCDNIKHMRTKSLNFVSRESYGEHKSLDVYQECYVKNNKLINKVNDKKYEDNNNSYLNEDDNASMQFYEETNSNPYIVDQENNMKNYVNNVLYNNNSNYYVDSKNYDKSKENAENKSDDILNNENIHTLKDQKKKIQNNNEFISEQADIENIRNSQEEVYEKEHEPLWVINASNEEKKSYEELIYSDMSSNRVTKNKYSDMNNVEVLLNEDNLLTTEKYKVQLEKENKMIDMYETVEENINTIKTENTNDINEEVRNEQKRESINHINDTNINHIIDEYPNDTYNFIKDIECVHNNENNMYNSIEQYTFYHDTRNNHLVDKNNQNFIFEEEGLNELNFEEKKVYIENNTKDDHKGDSKTSNLTSLRNTICKSENDHNEKNENTYVVRKGEKGIKRKVSMKKRNEKLNEENYINNIYDKMDNHRQNDITKKENDEENYILYNNVKVNYDEYIENGNKIKITEESLNVFYKENQNEEDSSTKKLNSTSKIKRANKGKTKKKNVITRVHKTKQKIEYVTNSFNKSSKGENSEIGKIGGRSKSLLTHSKKVSERNKNKIEKINDTNSKIIKGKKSNSQSKLGKDTKIRGKSKTGEYIKNKDLRKKSNEKNKTVMDNINTINNSSVSNLKSKKHKLKKKKKKNISMENINKNITNEFCSMERKGTVLLSNMSIKKIDNANSCTLNEPLEENTLNYESNNNCSNSNLSKDKEKDRNILCNKYYSDEETNSLNKMYTSNIPEISNYYKEIQAINYILSNINNPNFLNSLELNDLINIEKKFINENIYINKQIIACNVKNEKSNDEMVEKNERKVDEEKGEDEQEIKAKENNNKEENQDNENNNKEENHDNENNNKEENQDNENNNKEENQDNENNNKEENQDNENNNKEENQKNENGIIYDSRFSIIYLEHDLIYLKKNNLKVILNVLLSNVYCFFEIKLTIILLNFFISNNCQWSFSLFPLSLINKLIHKFSLKINKKVPKYKLENMNINSPNIPYTYLFICDGSNYLCINDNSLNNEVYENKMKLNNIIGYYHYINLNRLTYYLEKVNANFVYNHHIYE
ncbi:hypothetical protein PFMC_03405 [Plasmodium falciparum CAMP/Malaysia]|uniref:Uncharacterized protein n=1 Tax=Plasmodium falciparum (isolate Camp / Malaysia) TaxID=5835 RepID=A0A024X6I0_PLAFC|nr:hypothetical protein PFMC_03405 [Plasmodium falciparum CAMP/Malaysia]